MKKLLLLVFLCFPFALVAQNTGVGTSNPLEFFSVGASSQFRVNASGNIVRINDVAYSFPASQATTGSVLANDGTGNLTWTKVTAGNISATGTPSSSTYLRGDGAWASAGGGSYPQVVTTQTFSGTATSGGANLTSFSITSSGYYLVTAYATMGTETDWIVILKILEGATLKAQSSSVVATGAPYVVSISSVVYLSSATTLNLNFSIPGGSNVTVSNGQITVTRLQ